MNTIATFTLVLITSLLQANAGNHTSAYDNQDVRFEFTLNRSEYARGDTGTIFVFLTPNEGVHVNTEPPIECEFGKQSHITFGTKTVMPKDSATGYLDAQQPVAISFMLDKKTPAGAYTIHGKLKYFFCSEKEGWCKQFVQPLTLKIQVKK